MNPILHRLGQSQAAHGGAQALLAKPDPDGLWLRVGGFCVSVRHVDGDQLICGVEQGRNSEKAASRFPGLKGLSGFLGDHAGDQPGPRRSVLVEAGKTKLPQHDPGALGRAQDDVDALPDRFSPVDHFACVSVNSSHFGTSIFGSLQHA
jgi:hypothetical protein